jgi:hypothetical protein
MNDAELDRLLDTWKVPPPPASLRAGLKARFPRAEPRRFARPLRWILVLVTASATLAVGFEKRTSDLWDSGLVRVLSQLSEGVIESFAVWRASALVNQIRESEPKVYVNGQLVAPLRYGHGASMDVQVPGEGVYSIITYPAGLSGWVEAGRIHGSMIEFQAGSKQVRIECNKPIVDFDRPVFALRRQ